MSKKGKKLLITSLIFSQILLASSQSHADSIILNKNTTDGVNVRIKEDVNSDILGGIEDFSPYEIKGESENWYEIEFEGKKAYVGKEWFFKLNHTSLIEETNLKKEANSDSENLTEYKLAPSTKVTVLEFLSDSDFVKVSYDESFMDNQTINLTNVDELENNKLLYNLAESEEREVKTITLGQEENIQTTPSVVTLSSTPETVEIGKETSDEVKIGYVKLSSLAITKRDEDELSRIEDFYKEVNDHIKTKEQEEEALRNQVREITQTTYVTTTTYQNQAPTNPSTIASQVPSQTVPVTGSNTGIELYKWATQYVGRPYVLGGVSLTNGIDCSGFTMQIYRQVGIELPHRAQSQQRYGIEIPWGNERAGDLVFYGTSLNNITHVGMADGNGNMIHASSPRVGIIISPIRNPISIRRIVQ